MSLPHKELTGSVPDLSSINITRRKRGHGDEFMEAFDQFTSKITATLDAWKIDFSRETTDIKNSLKIIDQTANELKTDINCIKEDFLSIKKTVGNLSAQQNEIQEEVKTLKSSLQFYSDSYDDLKKQIDSCTKETNTIIQIHTELADLKMQNRKLQSTLNANDQRDRALNIEVVGLPEMKDENLTEIVLQLGKQTNIEISLTDIIQVNRVTSFSKTQARPKNIIAKLRTRQLKDNLISQARKCRLTTANFNIHGKVVPIFVNEHLTLHNKGLLKKVKDLAKVKEYQFAWTKNGRIFVKKGATTHAIQVSEEDDLKKII